MEYTTNRPYQNEYRQFRTKKIDTSDIKALNELKYKFLEQIQTNFYQNSGNLILTPESKNVIAFVFNWIIGENIDVNLNKGLLFQGVKGVGKSCILKATCQFIHKLYNVKANYITANTFAKLFRGQNDDDGLNLEKIFNCKLLFVDDIGVEDLKVFNSLPIQELIRERYDLKLITSFSTNESTSGLIEKYTKSIEDKITHMTYLIPFSGESFRK